MVKIIQVDSFSGLGGGQQVMFEIVKGLRDKFNFLIVAPPGIFLERYSRLGIRTHKLKAKNFVQIIERLRDFIQEERPAILHLQGTRAAFWGRLAVIGLESKPKIVYTLHGFHIIRRSFLIRWLLIIMERFLNRWTDILVCVSEADRKLVLRYKTIPSEKIKVIKNGIDIAKFQVDREEIQNAKKELGLTGKFVLSAIGRLHPPKDFSTVLRALRSIVSQIRNVKLLIVGDGPLRKSLENETAQLGLNEYVKFLGFREDMPVLINLSDIIILSTHWEALGLVCLEAGAARKPIIASNVDGPREAVIDGKTGFLFEPKSEKDLADKILKLYKDKELRKAMGESGYQFVSENFNKEKMIQNYKNLYQSLI